MTPTRMLDTRAGSGHHVFATLGGGTSGRPARTGGHGVAADAEAVVLNVTVTGPTAGGFLTAYPTGEPGRNLQPQLRARARRWLTWSRSRWASGHS